MILGKSREQRNDDHRCPAPRFVLLGIGAECLGLQRLVSHCQATDSRMQGKNEKRHLMLSMSCNSLLIWKLCVFLVVEVVEVEAKEFMLGECRAAVLYCTGSPG